MATGSGERFWPMSRSAAAPALRSRRARRMADSIPRLEFMADTDGNVFWLNRRYMEYTGETLETIANSAWSA